MSMFSKRRSASVAGLAAVTVAVSAPAAHAAPEAIYVPTGLVAPDGLVSDPGIVTSVENAWPVYADVVWPALRPVFQVVVDVTGGVLVSITQWVASLPPELAALVPAVLH